MKVTFTRKQLTNRVKTCDRRYVAALRAVAPPPLVGLLSCHNSTNFFCFCYVWWQTLWHLQPSCLSPSVSSQSGHLNFAIKVNESCGGCQAMPTRSGSWSRSGSYQAAPHQLLLWGWVTHWFLWGRCVQTHPVSQWLINQKSDRYSAWPQYRLSNRCLISSGGGLCPARLYPAPPFPSTNRTDPTQPRDNGKDDDFQASHLSVSSRTVWHRTASKRTLSAVSVW